MDSLRFLMLLKMFPSFILCSSATSDCTELPNALLLVLFSASLTFRLVHGQQYLAVGSWQQEMAIDNHFLSLNKRSLSLSSLAFNLYDPIRYHGRLIVQEVLCLTYLLGTPHYLCMFLALPRDIGCPGAQSFFHPPKF
eukprot:TRINITY_DN27961_c4_g1_i1.p1 TRINITY_DN27961_c4_g1~~TRINITY_DN27961_c4_g1_i1.p1  ORF type:complete len:138 (+),score=7.79 TRINITY_DN27961_c4_g1_i1:726-1139(+)